MAKFQHMVDYFKAQDPVLFSSSESSVKAMIANKILNFYVDEIPLCSNGSYLSPSLVSLSKKYNVLYVNTMFDDIKSILYEKKIRFADEKVEPDIEYYKEFYIWARHYIHKLEEMQSKMFKSVLDEVDKEWEESRESRYEQARQEAEMATQEQRERWENNLTDDIGYGRGVRPDKSSRTGFSDGWQKK